MKIQGNAVQGHPRQSLDTWSGGRIRGGVLLALLSLSACGPLEDVESADAAPALETRAGALTADNGLAFNGLAFNGLAFNGLAFNGLSFNGLSTTQFRDWFQQDSVLHDTVMKYVIQCAMGSGQQLKYTHPTTQKTYTWNGLLGLTPDWASGKAPSEVEQQLVSACLAAHGNKYGAHVPISILGRNAKDKEIPLAHNELNLYPNREACFFGNLFKSEGLYVANDGTRLSSTESATRMCGLVNTDGTVREECEPLAFIGSCATYCQPGGPGGRFYEKCTYNGKQYRPLVTRMRDEDIYRCGDNVCQLTEKCGTGGRYDSCKADCGSCG